MSGSYYIKASYNIEQVENLRNMYLDMEEEAWSTSVDNATRTDYAVAWYIVKLLKLQVGNVRCRYFICSEEEV